MSALNILYYVLITFIIWTLILSTIIGVMIIRTLKQVQASARNISSTVESTLQSLRPSRYLNAGTAESIVKWGIKQIFN
jgi:hypothetical protein